MLPKNSIRIQKRDLPFGEFEVQASLRLAADARVSGNAYFGVGICKALQMAEEHATRVLWNSIYGDLTRPLRELEMHCRRSMAYSIYSPTASDIYGTGPIESQFKIINELLRCPTPTTSA